MNEETGRKSTNRKLVPPWHFFKNHRERGKEVKKVKVCANAMSPPSLSPCQSPALHSFLLQSMLVPLFFSPFRLLGIRLIFSLFLL